MGVVRKQLPGYVNTEDNSGCCDCQLVTRSRLPATNRRLFTAGRARRVVRGEDRLEVNLEHESARLHEAAGLMFFVDRRGSRRFIEA